MQRRKNKTATQSETLQVFLNNYQVTYSSYWQKIGPKESENNLPKELCLHVNKKGAGYKFSPCDMFAKAPSLYFPVTDQPFLVTITQTFDKSIHKNSATKLKYSFITKLKWRLCDDHLPKYPYTDEQSIIRKTCA